MSEKYRIAVLILNWRSPEETIRCISSLDVGIRESELVVVVENGSNDGSEKLIQKFLRENASCLFEDGSIRKFRMKSGLDLIFKCFPSNAGFAGGMNRAIEVARKNNSEDLFLLNNDAEVSWEDIYKMHLLSMKKGGAIVGPLVMDFFDRSKVIFSGRKWPHLLFSSRLQISDAAEDQPTGYVEGSAMLLSEKFVDMKLKCDGSVFDERYFLYCEDVDLSLRGKSLGFPCYIATNARAYHKVSYSSGGAGNTTAYYYITRNKVLLVKKLYGSVGKALFLLYYIPSRVILALIRILKKDDGWHISKVVFSALYDSLLNRYGIRS